MNPPALATVEVETGSDPTAAVIWLHGLGADGHDFEPAVPALAAAGARALRFVFPHAPVRPVTLNAGARMRAWYDIRGFDRHTEQDQIGVRESDAAIRALIRRENARGIATERIVLAGFSQGGAMALFTGTRFTERLAGIIGLSCYVLLEDSFAAERSSANRATPIFLAHGSFDAVVDPRLGEETRALLLAAAYPVEWHSYPMPHTVSAEEIAAIAAFLQRVL
ncbi:MAG TPA: alpha/beta fold hydrolase [Steroidobacteraceae bacterium]|jgi:phospholipase/carboxylesterase|nr:alpha/beta fold hydrolase [Steroidobacteraceae bacterium]